MSLRGLYLALVLASAASAATIPFQVTGVTGGFVVSCGGEGCGGKFQSELGGTVDASGNLEGGQTLFVYCVDSHNTVDIPSGVYDVNVSTLTNGSDLSNTRYGQATAQWQEPTDPSLPITFRTSTFSFGANDSLTPTVLQRYQMAAWLVDQYSALPNTDRGAIQDAIWQVMDVVPPQAAIAEGNYVQPPSPSPSTPAAGEVGNLIADSASFVKYDYSDAFFSQFRIITNAAPVYLEGQDPAQELLTMIPTPEPFSFAAVTGLILAAMVAVRLKSRRAQA